MVWKNTRESVLSLKGRAVTDNITSAEVPDIVRACSPAKLYMDLDTTDAVVDGVLTNACRIARVCANSMDTLVGMLLDSTAAMPHKGRIIEEVYVPLMIIPNQEGEEVSDKIIVFPNLIVPLKLSTTTTAKQSPHVGAGDPEWQLHSSLPRLSLANPDRVSDVFSSMISDRLIDRDKGGNALKKWEGRSAIKHVNRRETMTLGKALAKYSNIFDVMDMTEDHERRDVVAIMLSELHPITMTIVIDDPKEFSKMYVNGPASCMTVRQGKERSWNAILNHGLHPAAWYAYHPYIGGAYLSKGGKILARVILHWLAGTPGSADEAVGYILGRIYGDAIYQNQLVVLLKKKYGKKLTSDMQTTPTRPSGVFYIPAVGGSGPAAIMPIPYIDGYGCAIYAQYDKGANRFAVQAVEGGSDLSYKIKEDASWVYIPNDRKGYRTGADLAVSCCVACGRTYRPGTHVGVTHHITGEFTCGSDCASKVGWVITKEGDGSRVWLSRRDTVEDSRLLGTHYSNIRAMLANGAGIACSDPYVVEEDPVFTMLGTTIIRADKSRVMAISEDALDALTRNDIGTFLIKDRLTVNKVTTIAMEFGKNPVDQSAFEGYDWDNVVYPDELDEAKIPMLSVEYVTSVEIHQ